MAKTSSCPRPKDWEEYAVTPVPVVGSFTVQHLLLMISVIAAGITMLVSYFLIHKHLHRYTEPKQQRQIVRVIFTPVVYATLSALSIINYSVAEYMQPLIELYETFALAALFLLFVEYVAPDEHTRPHFFATLERREPKSRLAPTTKYKVVAGGSQTWFERKWFAVFLFVIIDPMLTVVQEVTMVTGDWCSTSWSPRFAHIWITILENFFLGWAVLCVVLFYLRFQKEPDFAYHKPGLKILSFKLIVAVNFLQSIIFGSLNIKTDQKITGYDLKYGIPAALVAVEQILFAIFFHYSFRSREYHESMKQDMATPRMGTFRAAANAFNPMDLIRAVIKVPGYASSLRSTPSNDRGRSGQGMNDSHLEPMMRPDISYGGPAMYQAPPRNITVTQPQETGYTGAYAPPGYSPLTPPQQAAGATEYYDETRQEDGRLNLPGYGRSRDSSVDAEQRSTRQML